MYKKNSAMVSIFIAAWSLLKDKKSSKHMIDMP